jgi:hypothetical protein
MLFGVLLFNCLLEINQHVLSNFFGALLSFDIFSMSLEVFLMQPNVLHSFPNAIDIL